MPTTTTTPKRVRRRLAKSELLLFLATTAQRWSEEVRGTAAGCRPFSEWGDDDPMVDLAHRYDLSADDLSRLLFQIAEELEGRSMRAGFEDTWR